jgi:two-component system, OmpR family, sensor histidine kinase BaeS
MRLRIVHQLSLLLAGSVLLSVVAVGGLVAWNLRAGFSDYLRSRDAQQLERFAQVVAERAVWKVSSSGPDPLPMRELMDEFLHREGMPPPPDARPGPRPPPEGPPGARPSPGRGGDGFPQRVQVVDLQGRRLGGPPFPPGRTLLEEPVRVAGLPVAYVRMLPSTELQAVDARFLRRQYTGLSLAVAVTLALALLAAWVAARWLGGPLRNVQAATRRIAGGELSVTVPVSGSREMAELIQDVNRMAAALKHLEGARRSWIAQISHELRTPLSVLLGELESIQDGARVPTAQVVANLRDEVLQLVRLVNDLHTVSMADLGAMACEFSEGRAGEALERCVARFAPRADTAGLALEVSNGANPLVRWDFGRIEQLMTNLLENCLRYTAAPGRVSVRWTADGSSLQLRVEDTPPGVDDSQLELLFEPLYRADVARQRSGRAAGQGGSGLGLAICRGIVQAHAGTIRASRSALGGVCIEVSLPLDAAAQR